MTDREKLTALPRELGIPFADDPAGDVVFGQPRDHAVPDSAKAGGYYGFFASFEFDEAGVFVRAGVWE